MIIKDTTNSYVLFIELAYNILNENGVMAFIIPDSLFDPQNERLRKFLVEKTQIKVIARLGEKIFDEFVFSPHSLHPQNKLSQTKTDRITIIGCCHNWTPILIR